jgi:hypothetical protein
MKLMKVIGNNKNILIQEFQLNMESKLIQVSNTKMHLIQFVSMMMVTQMKLMKANPPKQTLIPRESPPNKESKPASLQNLAYVQLAQSEDLRQLSFAECNCSPSPQTT